MKLRPKHLLGISKLFLFLSLTTGCTSQIIKSEIPSSTFQSGQTPINGINMYYEVYGHDQGVPLVLLHGGGSTIQSNYSKIIPLLAKSRKVIAVEEQAHGRTTDRDKPIRFESSADDVGALLKSLNIKSADIMGFSNGGTVAIQVAIRHPELVHKLIVASGMTKKSGAYPQLWKFIKQANLSNMPGPLKEAFLKVTPDPAKLQVMHDKDVERMLHFKDIPDKEVKSIRAATLILIGDRDVVRPEHGVELMRLIPNSRLAILPAGHGDYLGEVLTTKTDDHSFETTAGLIESFLALSGA